MTRFWPQGAAVSVQVDAAGRPTAFRWKGRRHPVAAVVRTWRVDTGWWRRRVWREYVTVVTTTGLLAVLYRDVEGGGWYLVRVYD